MCGISGYISMSDKRPDKTKLEEMFKSIQLRGRDASGFATLDAKTLRVVKAPIEADELITRKAWKKLTELPEIMIMHTRAATQGAVANNDNNHPIRYKKYTAIHNGVINNEADFDVPLTQVDSMAILKSWHQNKGDIKEVTKSLQGSFAVALLDTTKPGKLTLFRHTSPIELLLDQKDEILYFASTVTAVEKVKENSPKNVKGFYIDDRYQNLNFPNNSYMEVTVDEGLTNFIEELETKPTVYAYDSNTSYRKSYPRYERKNSYAGDYYYGSEDYDEDYSWGGNYLPAKTNHNRVDTLFLEYLEPTTKEEYEAVNEKLKTSNFVAIECPSCHKPTLLDIKEVNPLCVQCKNKITNTKGATC